MLVIAIVSMRGPLVADPLLAADAGATDSEIRVGNVVPYTGPLGAFAFGAMGKAEAADFEMINPRGGIDGHKIRFISHYDS